MSSPVALVLAAGRGTRMRSRLAKVLHPLCGLPMARWVIDAARAAGCRPAVVIGHQAEAVREGLGEGLPADAITWIHQPVPLGTGAAVRVAARAVPAEGTLLVLYGDTPLVRPETLRALMDAHRGAKATVLTAKLAPEAVAGNAFGRIVRDASGAVLRIVEVGEATPEELAIDEVNTGLYAFDAGWLFREVVPRLAPHPPKGEYYLTDAIEAAARAGGLQAQIHPDLRELEGINHRAALARSEADLRARINRRWMLAGVTLRQPETTCVDASVELAQDVEIGPGAVLRGRTRVGEGARIGPYAVLTDTAVAAGAWVRAGTICEGAVLGEGVVAGPMARLREGTVLEPGVKVGNFVETKKATLRAGAKASHLSYIGDAEVGADANLGAGTITCNYDGFAKHRTTIGARAFIGSNSALVAPVSVGDGAIVGAGSVIGSRVPADALAITRAPQRNLKDKAPGIRARYARRAGVPVPDEGGR